MLKTSILLLISASDAFGFFVPSRPMLTFDLNKANNRDLSSLLSINMVDADASLHLASTESWRQYVPLVVSLGVIVDILLGSPLANIALAPLKRQTVQEDEEKEEDFESRVKGRSSKARIDADKVAEDALSKAQNVLELRRFLEDNKTDYDRMQEIKKKIDISMQDIDDDLAARQKIIDENK